MAQLAELPPITAEGCLLLHDVAWDTYEEFLKRFGESHIFLTYDQGTLEIMAPLARHDRNKSLIAMLIEAISVELGIHVDPFGSTTIRRRAKQRGLEPDEAYYVANADKVWDLDEELDFDQYPVPDLAVEIEVSRPIGERLSVYSGLEFPEIWRYRPKMRTIEFLHRMTSGKYAVREKSRAFPFLASADLQRFLNMRGKVKVYQIVREFQQWVRQFKK